MIRSLLKDFFYGQERKLIQRSFNPKFFLKEDNQKLFERNGYVKLDNVLTQGEVNELLKIHSEAEDSEKYEAKKDKYFGSFSFKDKCLVENIRTQTFNILTPILDRNVDTSVAFMPLGGGYCINPPHSIEGCFPHQDPSSVDEVEFYSMSMWISLTDMNAQNGCLHIIPGSHLWGNICRNINYTWAFNDYNDKLWDFLIPIPLKAGDILFFDFSTIHASSKNTTDKSRIGLNVPILPIHAQKFCFYPAKSINTVMQKLDVYTIDEKYFTEENETERPSSKYAIVKSMKINNQYSMKNIKNLIKEFNEKDRFSDGK
ncbi:MAG: phytanoyl-CoA dioxygenase family protein [Bacteroidetes bacterium]|nr:phytanoyl-CoA dioxygenase family protein [Bacteroidota bacterium]